MQVNIDNTSLISHLIETMMSSNIPHDAIIDIIEADHKCKMSIIENMKPSEYEIECMEEREKDMAERRLKAELEAKGCIETEYSEELKLKNNNLAFKA